jgi:hypothetical protein
MKLFARGSHPLDEILGKGRGVPARDFEALLLAHSISVDGGLVFQIESDRAENLGESQSFKFCQNRFRGEPFVEALDDGIE